MWIADMTGGRGWIAVSLVIFARWSPWRALAGALLFGGIEALIPQLAAMGVRLPQYFCADDAVRGHVAGDGLGGERQASIHEPAGRFGRAFHSRGTTLTNRP